MGFCGTPAHPTALLTVRGGLWPLTGGCWQAGMLGPARVGVGVSAGGAAAPTLLFFPFAPRGLGASGGQAQAWALQPQIPPDVGSSGGPREAALSPSP